MPKVYLSIGTNLGDRHANLQTAVDKLTELYPVLGVSKIYETQPVGEVVQDDFYNIALALEVPDTLKPEVLLTQTQQIEKDMKRVKTIHWGPRKIDLDILLFGDVRLVSETLTFRMLKWQIVVLSCNPCWKWLNAFQMSRWSNKRRHY